MLLIVVPAGAGELHAKLDNLSVSVAIGGLLVLVLIMVLVVLVPLVPTQTFGFDVDTDGASRFPGAASSAVVIGEATMGISICILVIRTSNSRSSTGIRILNLIYCTTLLNLAPLYL